MRRGQGGDTAVCQQSLRHEMQWVHLSAGRNVEFRGSSRDRRDRRSPCRWNVFALHGGRLRREGHTGVPSRDQERQRPAYLHLPLRAEPFHGHEGTDPKVAGSIGPVSPLWAVGSRVVGSVALLSTPTGRRGFLRTLYENHASVWTREGSVVIKGVDYR